MHRSNLADGLKGMLNVRQGEKPCCVAQIVKTRRRFAAVIAALGLPHQGEGHEVVLRAGKEMNLMTVGAMLRALDDVSILPNQRIAVARVQDRIETRG